MLHQNFPVNQESRKWSLTACIKDKGRGRDRNLLSLLETTYIKIPFLLLLMVKGWSKKCNSHYTRSAYQNGHFMDKTLAIILAIISGQYFIEWAET